MTDQPATEAAESARRALRDDNPAALRQLFDRYPELKARINDPVGDFDSPLVTGARSAAMLDVLLEAGADINARSQWWAGGFGLVDLASPDLATYAIARGAIVTVHAAARLGMLERLQEPISADPDLVHAKGGDGQTPLHFARTVDIAAYLLDQGANIDALDVDHESTPAQYMVRERPDVARYLVRRGCKTDLLMAAALGDSTLALEQLRADRECIRMRVSDEYFPLIGPKTGGTIYQWHLGWYVSACQVASSFGHSDLLQLLMDHCPPEEKLLNACWLHDEGLVDTLLAQHPLLAQALPGAGRRQLAHAARNDDLFATRLMVQAGLPADTFSQHHATPLHWAAWHGNADLVRLILPLAPSVHDTDNEYHSTPLSWAVYASEHGWHPDHGDHAGTVALLLDAGAKLPKTIQGSEPVRVVLRERGMT